jgi:hypothetical protein
MTHVDAVARTSKTMQHDWYSGRNRTPEYPTCVLGLLRAPFTTAAQFLLVLDHPRGQRPQAKRL